jgi:hypothetical protein
MIYGSKINTFAITFTFMMTINFTYNKEATIKGLRHHFIAKPDIRTLIVLLNVFAIISVALFYLKKIQPISFFIFSLLWFGLLIVVWRILPVSIYNKTKTFKDEFVATFGETDLILNTHKGRKCIPWKDFSFYKENPDFFYLYLDGKTFFMIPKAGSNEETTEQMMREKIRKEIDLL